MATDLKSHAPGVHLTRFAGGTKGSCVQITTKKFHEVKSMKDLEPSAMFFDNVSLTRAQAAALAADLLDFAQFREEEDFSEKEALQGLTSIACGAILYITIRAITF